uniref:Ovule protein n=1 Tax=Mesocestoides corti TaxID=53468 RepID=A0A5K3FCB2_MESCO
HFPLYESQVNFDVHKKLVILNKTSIIGLFRHQKTNKCFATVSLCKIISVKHFL